MLVVIFKRSPLPPLSWKVPYALDRPLTSLPPGMLMSTSYTKPQIHRSSHGTPGTSHTLPGTSTLLLMVVIANSRWPNTWASNPAPYKSALRQNHACRPWQSEHERAPLGWISRGSTYAHCACAGHPPLTHTLDRRLISVTPQCRPGDKLLSEPMVVSLLRHICVTWPKWVKVWHLPHIERLTLAWCWNMMQIIGYKVCGWSIRLAHLSSFMGICWWRHKTATGNLPTRGFDQITCKNLNMKESLQLQILALGGNRTTSNNLYTDIASIVRTGNRIVELFTSTLYWGGYWFHFLGSAVTYLKHRHCPPPVPQ